ncbi:methylation-associated defense system protein MAD4 [Actinoplanes derwentensis]|uniref:DUF4276 domain-containing protein n=1 Tax=Actinoplanes derwentensis TaxID=113562 RepID=A0A1H2BRS9_9ACTN|nr:hypothetical protein [Actinoplanes derwentensis]GID83029.1 hypothetical protein Ade03nite_19530 [Actinoplanes derwentensis]SDT60908.1 hypothetical protein SAMN04489716_4836 [Actinoplanes derwentensis]
MPASKRDVVFLVADGSMEQMVRGFVGEQKAHLKLGCGRFTVEPTDIVVASRRDPEVYGLAHQLLRPYATTHRHAVVMLDNDWEGSPGVKKIRDRIAKNVGQEWDEYAVIVLDPELEAWVWQDNPSLAPALGCPPNFRQLLATSGHWPVGQAKPADPKKALEYLRRRHRADPSKAVFRRVAGRVSVRNCTDGAFLQLRDTLRDWFPEETL